MQPARLIGETRDPTKDWFLIVRAASPRAHDRFEGDARLAQLVYDAAEVLRRLLFDLTGEVEPDAPSRTAPRLILRRGAVCV
jgi:hypothetical protein